MIRLGRYFLIVATIVLIVELAVGASFAHAFRVAVLGRLARPQESLSSCGLKRDNAAAGQRAHRNIACEIREISRGYGLADRWRCRAPHILSSGFGGSLETRDRIGVIGGAIAAGDAEAKHRRNRLSSRVRRLNHVPNV